MLDKLGLTYFWTKIKSYVYKEIDANRTVIEDNLTSTSTTSALSANQGKVLEDKKLDISDLDSKLQSTLPTLLVNDGYISSLRRDASIYTDLNDITEEGYYLISVTYGWLDNYPPISNPSGGRLNVSTPVGYYRNDVTIWQEFIVNGSFDVYVRYYRPSTGAWSDWVEETTSGNLEIQLQETLPTLTVNDGYISALRRTPTSDFDTMLTEGYYSIYDTVENSPYTTSTGRSYGRLNVTISNGKEHNNSTTWIWQTYYDGQVTTGNKIFTRKKIGAYDWTEWQEITSPYRVGDIVVTSENVSPATDFGGTWTLVDKGFKYNYIATSYDVEDGSIIHRVLLDGNTFTDSFVVNIGTSTPFIDTDIAITQIDYTNLGLIDMVKTLNYLAGGYVGNSGVLMYSIIGKNLFIKTVASGTFSNTTYTSSYNSLHVLPADMIDSFCDKFYWKKVS